MKFSPYGRSKVISVIIPTCDRPAEFLRAAIESARAQSLAPYEVIVVDNGTSDADPAVFPEGVTLYRLPPRVGPSRARNFGAAMARGTHLSFLDDDDWWDTDFLREAWAVLEAEGVRCVYGRKDIWRRGRVEHYKLPSPETLTIPVLLSRNPGTGGQNLLIEKPLFWRVGGFDERLRTSEDKALALELLLADERIAIAPKAAAIMRSHDGARARQARLHKILFSWKYRRLLGLGGLIAEIVSLVRPRLGEKLRPVLRRIRT